MMALADMANGKAVLAELSLRVPDESVVASDLGMISLPSTALQDLTLPQAGAQGTQFTWASSNEAVISKDGKVTRPAQDTMVTLTVTGTYGEATQTHDFVVTVPALRAAGGDEAYADLQNLSLLPEYINDIDLPTQGENGSTITWASSNEAVISKDGKVTRPAIGQPDAHLTLTATASYGEASQSRTFEVKVWALVDTTTNEGMVKDAYYRAREFYYKTPVLTGYWNTWAAYAALGEELWERDYIYDTSPNSEAQKGAQILGIVAQGENPYNYNGVNYVKRLQDAGYAGPYAVPVYNMLARDAAGIKMKPDEMASQRASASKSWMGSLWMGPDIGGWACVLTCREIKDSTEYYNQAKSFLDAVSDNMAVNTTGSAALSAGCVVTGLTSYMAEGVTIDGIAGMDATKDEPWVSQNPIKMMYSQLSGGSGTDAYFNTQPTLELCDLYNVKYNGGHVAWVAFGVNKARVEKQVAKANEILANKALYTADSVKAVEAALETVKGISQERLNAKYADYGEEYYTLYDAVRYAKTNESAMADKAAADAVTAAIDALPAAAEITLESKEDVEAARAAFDKLTESQQGMVTAETTGKLAACEAAIAKLEADAADKAAADAVTEAINALPAADEMTLESKEAVEAARAAFDKLTETQQALVPKEAQEKLAAAEAAIAKLVATEADKAAAGAVTEAINALPAADEITLENKEAVEAARAAFDKLTETQQALVPKEAQEALAAAEAAIAKLEADAADKAAAAKVEESINALPAAADLTLANKEAVEAARAAFDKLTEAQQALVSKEAQDKLAAAEARIAELEKPDEPVELPFTDLTQDWYMDSIRYVYEHELMYGTTDTTFAPDDALTRGMFVTMLYRMEGKPEVTGSTSFTDVPEGAYYADAVAWASANGVVYGTSETAFSPEGKITREQMAAMMRRYASFKKLDTSAKADLSTFADASAVSAWATGDMQWAVASELLYGNTRNQLQPTANATRAQAAAILQRFATKIVK